MTRQYATEALVLGYRKLGEADRIVDLFTQSRGRVPTVVKGVRKVTSRWGGRLEPFTHLQVQLHAGRNLHTLTGADTVRTHAALRTYPACLQAGLSLSEMISRSTPELHRKPRTYNLLLRYLEQMETVCGAGQPADVAPVALLTLAAQLKLLLLAGFLPHVESCSVCGADAGLAGFSAEMGGAVCLNCDRKSFPMSVASLAAMRGLLEAPLAGALTLEAPAPGVRREIRRAIREICEFHLGVRLKVEPW